MRVPNADPIGRGVVWARRIERVTSTVVNPRCSRMRLTCVYSVAAASRALCAWSAEAAMPAPRGRKHFPPSQAKTPHFPAARNRTRSAVGRWRTSGWHVWEPYFSITVYSYEFVRRFLRTADPREEKDAEFFRLSRSRGAPPGRRVVKRRSRAPRSRLRGRTTRGAVFGANPGRGDSQPAASRSSSRRARRSRIAVVPSESFDSRPP